MQLTANAESIRKIVQQQEQDLAATRGIFEFRDHSTLH